MKQRLFDTTTRSPKFECLLFLNVFGCVLMVCLKNCVLGMVDAVLKSESIFYAHVKFDCASSFDKMQVGAVVAIILIAAVVNSSVMICQMSQ